MLIIPALLSIAVKLCPHNCHWYFSIVGQTIYLHQGAELDANANPEYEIYVSCDDGTDSSTAFLRVEVISDTTSDTELPKGMQEKSQDNILGYC